MKIRGASVARIVDRVENLREPFRENAIEWLCQRTQRPLSNLQLDLDQFLEEQDPFVRDFFIKDTLSVLDLAVSHFGDGETQDCSSRHECFDEMMHSVSIFHR
ncbi:MAG: hypothetical protein P8Z42_05130 [Anaerolineales bacterium]|jgi:hypothetical protein